MVVSMCEMHCEDHPGISIASPAEAVDVIIQDALCGVRLHLDDSDLANCRALDVDALCSAAKLGDPCPA